jgi:hypothetical protein
LPPLLCGMLQSTVWQLISGRRKRFVLREVSRRSQREIMAVRGRAANEVEACLKQFLPASGLLTPNWSVQIERKHMMGEVDGLPELVSYSYHGRFILSAWTRIVRDDLIIDLHAAPIARKRRARSRHPRVWIGTWQSRRLALR